MLHCLRTNSDVSGARSTVEKRLADAVSSVEAWKRKFSTSEASVGVLDQKLAQGEQVRNSLEERLGAAETEVRPT